MKPETFHSPQTLRISESLCLGSTNALINCLDSGAVQCRGQLLWRDVPVLDLNSMIGPAHIARTAPGQYLMLEKPARRGITLHATLLFYSRMGEQIDP